MYGTALSLLEIWDRGLGIRQSPKPTFTLFEIRSKFNQESERTNPYGLGSESLDDVDHYIVAAESGYEIDSLNDPVEFLEQFGRDANTLLGCLFPSVSNSSLDRIGDLDAGDLVVQESGVRPAKEG